MSDNFYFLEKKFPREHEVINLAESYLYSDPHSCVVKSGVVAEHFIKKVMTYFGKPIPKHNVLANCLYILQAEEILDARQLECVKTLKKKRDRAAHNFEMSIPAAIKTMVQSHLCIIWFYDLLTDDYPEMHRYEIPEPPADKSLDRLLREANSGEDDLDLGELTKKGFKILAPFLATGALAGGLPIFGRVGAAFGLPVAGALAASGAIMGMTSAFLMHDLYKVHKREFKKSS